MLTQCNVGRISVCVCVHKFLSCLRASRWHKSVCFILKVSPSLSTAEIEILYHMVSISKIFSLTRFPTLEDRFNVRTLAKNAVYVSCEFCFSFLDWLFFFFFFKITLIFLHVHKSFSWHLKNELFHEPNHSWTTEAHVYSKVLPTLFATLKKL